jgi:hypothetical protein
VRSQAAPHGDGRGARGSRSALKVRGDVPRTPRRPQQAGASADEEPAPGERQLSQPPGGSLTQARDSAVGRRCRETEIAAAIIIAARPMPARAPNIASVQSKPSPEVEATVADEGAGA